MENQKAICKRNIKSACGFRFTKGYECEICILPIEVSNTKLCRIYFNENQSFATTLSTAEKFFNF